MGVFFFNTFGALLCMHSDASEYKSVNFFSHLSFGSDILLLSEPEEARSSFSAHI